MAAIESVTADPSAAHARPRRHGHDGRQVTRAACAFDVSEAELWRAQRLDRSIGAYTTRGTTDAPTLLAAAVPGRAAPLAAAQQPCPDKNVMYWQAFPPGGESDLSARHQQVVLKKKCPAIDTIIQYKAGAGGGAAVGADEHAAAPTA